MRILVTGASGTIGSALSDALLARGDEVVGLSRDPERARQTNPTVSWHGWRATEERPPAAAFEGVDAVINLIGESLNQRLTQRARERARSSRIRATKNLVEGMLGAGGVRILVSQSAVGYYGSRGDAIVDESTPPGDDFLARLCVEWEREARGAEGTDVRVTITRTAPVLDPSSGLLKEVLLPFRLGLGGPLAGGRQYMPWVHPGDVVGILLWALGEQAAAGPVNVSAPTPITNREFTRVLGRVLGRPTVLPIPKLAVTALRGRELASAALSSQRVVPRRALDLGYEFRFPDLEPALRDLLGR